MLALNELSTLHHDEFGEECVANLELFGALLSLGQCKQSLGFIWFNTPPDFDELRIHPLWGIGLWHCPR